MTSNLAGEKKVREVFRPELINRLDGIMEFNSLSNPMIQKIVDLQLGQLVNRLEKEGYKTNISDGLKKHLVVSGFDQLYGARPLKRVINELILDELALQIVEGKIAKGDVITADFKQNKVEISVKKMN